MSEENEILEVIKPIIDEIISIKKVTPDEIDPIDVINALATKLIARNDFIDSVIGLIGVNDEQHKETIRRIKYKHKKLL